MQADYTCQCCDQFKGNNCQEVDTCQCKYGGECQAKADDPEKQVCACRLGMFHETSLVYNVHMSVDYLKTNHVRDVI